MNNLTDLIMMQKLVEIKYQQQQQSFARLMTQENRLRLSLKQLDQQLADSRSNNDTKQQAIGADILWQAWIGRKKRELNLKLAQILAVKERHVAQVREAYGKVLVTKELFGKESAVVKQEMAQSELDRAISSTLN
jgi:hypothetical protein